MADIFQAVKWLDNGKSVRRGGWFNTDFAIINVEFEDDSDNGGSFGWKIEPLNEDDVMEWTTADIIATDWEIA